MLAMCWARTWSRPAERGPLEPTQAITGGAGAAASSAGESQCFRELVLKRQRTNPLGALNRMTVLIIGAGVAGLTTALSLHQIGADCRVFESVERIEPLGVGINTLPHAVRELTELGLADRLAASGIPTAELAYYSKHGQPIWSEPRGVAAGYNWPQFSIHRGALQMILLNAVRERLGADCVATGHHLAGW